MNEAFLYFIWSYYLKGLNLLTVDNRHLQIIKTGTRNTDSGPDFFDARIKSDGILWVGNVEIHLYSSDWIKHKHQLDAAYDNIILHVVYECDIPVFRANGVEIPCLELKGKIADNLFEIYQGFLKSKQWIPCASDIGNVNHFIVYNWIQRLAFERLEEKAKTIKNQLDNNNNDFQEVFYRTLMRAYGFNVNGDAFEQLAYSLPFHILQKHKNDLFQLEALLFGQSGLLPDKTEDPYILQMKVEYHFLSKKYNLTPLKASLWKFLRLRPSNFPTLRIAQLAQLIFQTSGLLDSILTAHDMKSVFDLFATRTSDFWSKHYTFHKSHASRPKKMGNESIYSLFINTIIPFTFVYGEETGSVEQKEKALNWLSKLPSEHNHIVKNFKKLGIESQHAAQSQGLLQMKKAYCDSKRCLECAVGHYLIKNLGG